MCKVPSNEASVLNNPKFGQLGNVVECSFPAVSYQFSLLPESSVKCYCPVTVCLVSMSSSCGVSSLTLQSLFRFTFTWVSRTFLSWVTAPYRGHNPQLSYFVKPRKEKHWNKSIVSLYGDMFSFCFFAKYHDNNKWKHMVYPSKWWWCFSSREARVSQRQHTGDIAPTGGDGGGKQSPSHCQ